MNTCEIVQCQGLYKGKCDVNTKFAIKDCPAGFELVNTLKAKAELFDELIDYCNEKCPDTPPKECGLELCIKLNDLIDKAKELKQE